MFYTSPSNVDLRNASIYASNVALRKKFPVDFPNQLQDVVLVDENWSDEIRIEHPERLEKRAAFKFTNEKQCLKFSCFPYNYQGKLCLPNMKEHTWATITNQQFVSCQSACYEIKRDWDPEDPQPTMPELIYANGKCLIVNTSLKAFALFPENRNDGPLDGITNVPMWKYISDPTLDMRQLVHITSEYCQWFGLEFRDGNCYNPPGQWFAEQIFGATLTRYLGRMKSMGNMRRANYTKIISTNVYQHMMSTQFGRSMERNIRRAVRNLPSLSDEQRTAIDDYQSSRFLMSVNANIQRTADYPDNYDALLNDGNESTKSGSFMESVVNGEFFKELLYSLSIDITIDTSLGLLKKAMTKILGRLSSQYSSATLQKILQIGTKKVLTACFKANIMKLAIRTGLTKVAKLVAAAILKSLIALTNVAMWLFAVISIAGAILDLIDVGNFNMMLDSQYVFTMCDSVAQQYRLMYGTDPYPTESNLFGHMAELTPDILFHLSTIKAPSEKQVLENDPNDNTTLDDNDSDEDYATTLEATVNYLIALDTNSYGQILDWSRDDGETIPTSIKPISPAELTYALYKLDAVQTKAYNASFQKYFGTWQSYDTLKGIGASLLSINALIALLFSIAAIQIIQLTLAVLSFLVIVYFLNFYITFTIEANWIKKTPLCFSKFNNIFSNIIYQQYKTNDNVKQYVKILT